MNGNLYLNERSIAEHLEKFAPDTLAAISTNIVVEDSLPSTNTVLSQLAKDPSLKFPIALLARNQTDGMGRLGRKWHGGTGVLCVSVGVLFDSVPEGLDTFTLLCGLEICSVLSENFGSGFSIKWPNDIYLNSRKLSGMLANLMARAPLQGGGYVAIMGVGLNCSRDGVPDEIKGISADLSEILPDGESIDMNLVAAMVIGAVERAARSVEIGDVKNLRERFAKYDFLYGRDVEALSGGRIVCGKACGIGSRGELILKASDESENRIAFGDATLLKK